MEETKEIKNIKINNLADTLVKLAKSWRSEYSLRTKYEWADSIRDISNELIHMIYALMLEE